MKTIGERLAWARKQRKLSQQQVADRAGIAQSTIASAEKAHREKPRELLSIARALGVDPYWLETGTGEWQPVVAGDEPPPGTIYEAPTQLELEFLENFRTIMDEDQQRYIEEIAEKAAKMRAHMEKVLGPYGASPKRARTAADAKKTQAARTALEITDALRQKSLLPAAASKPIKK